MTFLGHRATRVPTQAVLTLRRLTAIQLCRERERDRVEPHIHAAPHFLAGLEMRYPFSRDVDAHSGPRVSSKPRFAVDREDAAESTEFDAITCCKTIAERCQNQRNAKLNIVNGEQVRTFGKSGDDVRSIQFHNASPLAIQIDDGASVWTLGRADVSIMKGRFYLMLVAAPQQDPCR